MNEYKEVTQKNLDALIRKSLAQRGEINPQQAMDMLLAQLFEPHGWYTFTCLGEKEEAAWVLRAPRLNLSDKEWAEAEGLDILHICNPEGYLAEALKRDLSAASEYAGLVRDKDDSRNDVASYYCKRCKDPMPERLARVARLRLAGDEIRKKT